MKTEKYIGFDEEFMDTIIVCDDDARARRAVEKQIRDWKQDLEVLCFSSGEELLEHYRPCQAVFLDIDMDGMNGIETGREIRKRDRETKIVYLTAYRDYVEGAFGVHAFQYLLKPADPEAIYQVLEEIFRYNRTARKKTILDFATDRGMVCLAAEDIYYFEYENRKIKIVMEKESYYMPGRIGSIAQKMQPFGFSVPHQSFVVNMLHVKNICGLQIFLDNQTEIPLSQKKQKVWKQELTAYLADRLEVD